MSNQPGTKKQINQKQRHYNIIFQNIQLILSKQQGIGMKIDSESYRIEWNISETNQPLSSQLIFKKDSKDTY